MLRKGCIRYGNTQKDVSFLMLLIALSLSIGGLWHQLQGGSMFYTDWIAVWTQFEFLFQKAGKSSYTNSAVLLGVILWAGYQHGINFYSANYFCL